MSQISLSFEPPRADHDHDQLKSVHREIVDLYFYGIDTSLAYYFYLS